MARSGIVLVGLAPRTDENAPLLGAPLCLDVRLGCRPGCLELLRGHARRPGSVSVVGRRRFLVGGAIDDRRAVGVPAPARSTIRKSGDAAGWRSCRRVDALCQLGARTRTDLRRPGRRHLRPGRDTRLSRLRCPDRGRSVERCSAELPLGLGAARVGRSRSARVDVQRQRIRIPDPERQLRIRPERRHRLDRRIPADRSRPHLDGNDSRAQGVGRASKPDRVVHPLHPRGRGARGRDQLRGARSKPRLVPARNRGGRGDLPCLQTIGCAARQRLARQRAPSPLRRARAGFERPDDDRDARRNRHLPEPIVACAARHTSRPVHWTRLRRVRPPRRRPHIPALARPGD